ncbi:MAG: type I secretion system permease/ATPase [Clostridium sp.]|nr:type I secretion system permease/ATPase [Acetatifactor muris]MCM1528362.1 type I secretion system permease/ATPase [Bacteroides sp.]MCM1563577.1 type I secretion system permease/ATPase [Clostridium sp.]
MVNGQNTGYLCFLILAKYLNVNVPGEEEERFRDAADTQYQLLRLARKLDLKAKAGRLHPKKLRKLSPPFIAERRDGEYLIVLNLQGDKVTILDPGKGSPEVIDERDFPGKLSGWCLLLGKKRRTGEETGERFGFRWFIPTILRFKKQFICVLIAVFTVQIIGILTPLMTQVVVDKVLSHHAVSTLHTIAVGILIAYIYELVISLAKNYLFVHTTNRIDVLLSAKLFHHLFALPLRYFESRRVGETVARVGELDTIRAFLTGTPLSSLIDLGFVTVYVVVLYFYSVPLAVIVTASIPVFALLSLVVTPLFKRSLDEKFAAGANAQSFLVESVTGIQTVKSFALEENFEEKWGDLQADYVKAGYKTSMISSASGSVANFVRSVVDLIVLVQGAQLVIAGTLSIGQLVAFRMLASRVSGPVLRLVQLWQEYQQASLSVERIGDIFNSPVELTGRNAAQTMPELQGRIRFEKVWFRYRADTADVLKGMSFEILAGRIVGLVGRSGSGKSTVSKLIQRLYIPQNGRISIDGMDLSVLNPVFLRDRIGVVLQENFMFNGSVAENICIHCPGRSIEEIMEAAKIAGAHDFIMELQEGYDTVIGEKGVSLSGGQKQRVAIARAIIHDPKILIFDEATSALDYESERIIQNNMREICRGRTVLIIAHRLSTLRIADEIMVMERGEIVERGDHETLLERDGLYAYLYHQQLRGEIERNETDTKDQE